jgi:hypothetical protein
VLGGVPVTHRGRLVQPRRSQTFSFLSLHARLAHDPRLAKQGVDERARTLRVSAAPSRG